MRRASTAWLAFFGLVGILGAASPASAELFRVELSGGGTYSSQPRSGHDDGLGLGVNARLASSWLVLFGAVDDEDGVVHDWMGVDLGLGYLASPPLGEGWLWLSLRLDAGFQLNVQLGGDARGVMRLGGRVGYDSARENSVTVFSSWQALFANLGVDTDGWFGELLIGIGDDHDAQVILYGLEGGVRTGDAGLRSLGARVEVVHALEHEDVTPSHVTFLLTYSTR